MIQKEVTDSPGQTSNPKEGLTLNFSRMNKILDINGKFFSKLFNDLNFQSPSYTEFNKDAVVQPGVKWIDLNSELEKKGIPLFWPIDPGRDAMFGGMISTGISNVWNKLIQFYKI